MNKRVFEFFLSLAGLSIFALPIAALILLVRLKLVAQLYFAKSAPDYMAIPLKWLNIVR